MCNNELITNLFNRISELIEQSRKYVAKAANIAMVATYYEIGRYIIEDEQQGKARAEYGKRILQELSNQLTDRFGAGWSVETLKKCRLFYSTYSVKIGSTVKTQMKKVYSVDPIDNLNSANTTYHIDVHEIMQFALPWSHYQILMRIDNPEERSFYEIEAKKGNWS